jgi:hypothetical protein
MVTDYSVLQIFLVAIAPCCCHPVLYSSCVLHHLPIWLCLWATFLKLGHRNKQKDEEVLVLDMHADTTLIHTSTQHTAERRRPHLKSRSSNEVPFFVVGLLRFDWLMKAVWKKGRRRVHQSQEGDKKTQKMGDHKKQTACD